MHKPLLRGIIHPWILAALTVLVIAMIGLAASAHVEALALAATADRAEESLLLEEDVAVILIAFGVFLEERGLLAGRVFEEPLDDRQDHLNEISERYGAYLLIIGLFMEVNDQIFEPLLLESGFATFGIGSMVVLDVLAALACAVYVYQLLVKR